MKRIAVLLICAALIPLPALGSEAEEAVVPADVTKEKGGSVKESLKQAGSDFSEGAGEIGGGMKSLGKDIQVLWFDAGHEGEAAEKEIHFQEQELRFVQRVLSKH